MATVNVEDLFSTLTEQTAEANAHRENREDTPARKVGRSARTLHNLLTAEGGVEDVTIPDGLTDALASFLSSLPTGSDAFDRSVGDKAAKAIEALVGVGMVDEAQAAEAIDAWRKARPGARSAKGEGESQGKPLVDKAGESYGVRMSFAYPDGDLPEGMEKDTALHHSTESSVSNEITKRAKRLAGVEDGRGFRPDEVRDAWRAFLNAAKEGNTDEHTFDWPLPDGRVMGVTLQRVA